MLLVNIVIETKSFVAQLTPLGVLNRDLLGSNLPLSIIEFSNRMYSHKIYHTILNFVSYGAPPPPPSFFFYCILLIAKIVYNKQMIYIYFLNILFIYLNFINLVGEIQRSPGQRNSICLSSDSHYVVC